MTTTDLKTTFSGSIPDYYDRCLGPAWFDACAKDLALRLPPRPPGDVLEIACGTGLGTRWIRERLDPSLRLVASDLSKAMLDYARTKLRDVNGVDWREADAMKLPFADREFGAIVCSFGFMFVPDKKAALREARRVLKDGGLLVFNVWDRIEENPCAKANAEVIEGLLPGDEEVRFRVPYEMHDEKMLRELLSGARFKATRIETKRFPIEGVSARSVAEGQIRGTPRGLLIQKRGIPFEEAVDAVTKQLEKAGGSDPFRSHCQAIVVEAHAI